ncbi:MAG: hypothetical protein U5K38_12965 [Woeseiaceae bacterium]|nr:hypothetical protein [Woeseiaceae bacterium]
MNRAITRQAAQRPGAHSVLALLMVAWLNLALMPCAMAFEAVPETEWSHGHEQPEQHEHDCPHCPPAGTTAADCLSPDESTLDARNGYVKLKDAPAEQPVVIMPPQFLSPTAVLRSPAPDRCYYQSPGTPPPLNVLYCVYLK